MILDNLSTHKGTTICQWAKRNRVELCFTPTYISWANPIEAHFGPLREFVLNNSNHSNHVVLTRRLHAYPRWRNVNTRDPELLCVGERRTPQNLNLITEAFRAANLSLDADITDTKLPLRP